MSTDDRGEEDVVVLAEPDHRRLGLGQLGGRLGDVETRTSKVREKEFRVETFIFGNNIGHFLTILTSNFSSIR